MTIIKSLLAITVLCTGITAFGMRKEALTHEKEVAAMFDAMHNNDAQAVENLLNESSDARALANAYHPNGIAVLREAASYGNSRIVDLLIQAGAHPNPQDSYNVTPLMLAVLGSNVDIVRKLINHGANVNATDNSGQSALDYVGFGGGTTEAQKVVVRKLITDAQ